MKVMDNRDEAGFNLEKRKMQKEEAVRGDARYKRKKRWR